MYSQDDVIAWEGKDPESPTFDEYKHNGLYCKSGLAFPLMDEVSQGNKGKCTIVDHVKHNGKRLEFPYQCNPNDNAKKCQLFFNITEPEQGVDAEQSYYETECKCSLDS